MRRIRYHKGLVFLTFLFLTLSIFFQPIIHASAMTDSWVPPAFQAEIKDTSNIHLLSQKSTLSYRNDSAVLSTTYTVSNSGDSAFYSWTLPFFSYYLSDNDHGITCSVNDTIVTPTHGYSKRHAYTYDIDSYDKVMDSRIDTPSLNLDMDCFDYTVTASEDTVFAFELTPDSRILYTFGRHTYYSENRRFEMKLATTGELTHFTVFGSAPKLELTDACKIDSKELSLGEYIDEYAEALSNVNVEYDYKELATIKIGEFLSSDYLYTDSDLYNACCSASYIFLDYSAELPTGNSIITISQPIQLGFNTLFKPTVRVAKILSPTTSVPTEFCVDSDYYVVYCDLPLSNNSYSGNNAEDISVSLCSVKNPKTADAGQPLSTTQIIILSIGCPILGALLIILIVNLVRYIKQKKRSDR